MSGATMDQEWKLTGRHVLVTLLAFFGVIFAVNGYFLYSALSTHTGVVAQEPYRKGLHYNDRIAADEMQQSLGWQAKLDLAGSRDTVALELKQPDGKPVTGLSIGAMVSRPTNAGADQKIALKETTAGVYSAPITKLADGTWIIDIEGKLPSAAPGEAPFRMKKRLWLSP